jgi:hypothetical protein
LNTVKIVFLGDGITLLMGWHANVSEKVTFLIFRDKWPAMYLATVQGMRVL